MHISQVSQHTNEQERARKASQPPRFCVKRLKPLLSRHMQWASIWTDRSPLALGWRLVSFLNMVASSFTIEEIRTAMQTAQHRGIFYHMWRLPTGNANNTFQKPPSSHWISGQNRPRYLDLRHRTIATLCGCNQNHLDSTGTPGSFLNRVVILLLFLFRNALFCFSKEEYHLLHYGCLWACAGQPFRRLESRSNVFYVLSTFPPMKTSKALSLEGPPRWRRQQRAPNGRPTPCERRHDWRHTQKGDASALWWRRWAYFKRAHHSNDAVDAVKSCCPIIEGNITVHAGCGTASCENMTFPKKVG